MNAYRTVFYVDVGDMPAEEVAAYIQKRTSELTSASKAKLALLDSMEIAANTLSGIAPIV